MTNLIEDEWRCCGFCGYEAEGPDAADLLPLNHVRHEPHRLNTPTELCDFCYASIAASRWLEGHRIDTALHRDLAVFMNMLRNEIRQRKATE